ncbi:hypothetical protein TNCV_398561, partial [Trichonephila clavipes]
FDRGLRYHFRSPTESSWRNKSSLAKATPGSNSKPFG